MRSRANTATLIQGEELAQAGRSRMNGAGVLGRQSVPLRLWVCWQVSGHGG